MGQKLIQTVNQMKVTCSYKNKAYVTNRLANGAEHWGFDCVKINRAKDELVTIWAQGDGIVLGKGTDQCYGNYVTVMYFDVEGLGNVVANYFHLASHGDGIVSGVRVHRDTRLGIMGMTGTYSTGIHLHTEMRQYTNGEAFLLSPFNTNTFKASTTAKWFDPLKAIYTKTSPSDSQKYETANDAYINADNKTPKNVV